MSASSSEFLTPSFVGGWTAVLAVLGVAGYQYYAKKQAPGSNKAKAPAASSAPRKQNRAKKQRQDAYSTSAQKAPAEEPKPAAASAESSRPQVVEDDDVDNRAFAAQMAQVKEGKKFEGKSSGEKKYKQKSVKQSRAAESPETKPVEEPSAPSSPGGADADADADDDQSPVASPEAAPVDAGGVSDMLEPAAAGPSVLKLTDTDKPKKAKKAAKEPEKAETKKQRQNRRKAEERKAAREEDEKDRKVLMEKQRRAAREAAGVPAKDGSQFMAANGNKSAWNAGAPNGSSKVEQEKKEAEPLPVQPLDTFEDVPTNGTAASVAPAEPKSEPAKDTWVSSVPSEEEQMEMLKDEDDWNTVPTKASKKSKKGQATEMPSVPPQEAKPVPQPAAPSNGRPAPSAQSYGSFSALSTKEDNVEEEQEWDV